MLGRYTDWCNRHGCSHAHCPRMCEHPQPMVIEDDRCICALCYAYNGDLVDVVPCLSTDECRDH